eukprot:88942_1
MSFCKFALLWSIVMVYCQASDYCAAGNEDYTIIQGEYEETGSTYNGRSYYQQSEQGYGCTYQYMLYMNDDVWKFGTSLGGSTTAYCSTSTTKPSDCTEWKQGYSTPTVLSNTVITSGSCSVLGCTNIGVSNSGSSSCNGDFTKSATNLYANSDSSMYWFWSVQSDKWMCSTSDQRTACSLSGIYRQQSTQGWFDMTIGGSQSIALSSGDTATFECQDTVPAPTPSPTESTPAPIAAPAITNYCTSGYSGYSVEGEYEETGSTYNGIKYYQQSEKGYGCTYQYMLYMNDNKWIVGPSLGSFSTYCSTETTEPSDCTAWAGFSNTAFTSGSCSVFGCTNIRVSNSGSSSCNGVFTKSATNLYANSGSTMYWFYSDKNVKWMCSTSDQRTACSLSALYRQQSTAGWFDMTDGGSSQSVALSSGDTATFECGVTTPSPVTASDDDICICTCCAAFTHNGQYINRNEQHNDENSYIMENSEGTFYLFWHDYGLWAVNTAISDSTSVVIYGYGADPVDAISSRSDTTASYGTCGCDYMITSGYSEIGVADVNDLNVRINNKHNTFLDLVTSKTGAFIIILMFIIGVTWSICICVYQFGFCKSSNHGQGYSKGKVVIS